VNLTVYSEEDGEVNSPRAEQHELMNPHLIQFLWWGRKKLGLVFGEDVTDYLSEQAFTASLRSLALVRTICSRSLVSAFCLLPAVGSLLVSSKSPSPHLLLLLPPPSLPPSLHPFTPPSLLPLSLLILSLVSRCR
jgi:hypothetical protein